MDVDFPEARHVWPALTQEQLVQLGRFRDALYEWNAHKNLTRIPPEAFDIRHAAESLLVAEFAGTSVLDIGTGPGFPAWPLACALPTVQVTALDSNGKMLDFLRSVLLENLEIIQGRIEEQDLREEFDLVTGRAFAPLAIQLECSAASCRIGGLVVPFRSAKDELEPPIVPQLGLRLIQVKTACLSDGVERVLPVYQKVEATPREHPRPWAIMKRGS